MKPERASSTYFAGQGGEGGQSEPAPTYAPVGSSVFGWAAFFHSAAISQLFFWFMANEFFRCWFFLNPDLHITFPPSYPTELATLLTYVLALPAN